MKNYLKKTIAILLALVMSVSTAAMAAGAQGTSDGFGQNGGSWYYYENGRIDTSRNDIIEGTVNGRNGWWYVVNGKVQTNYTGVSDYSNAYGWWYVKNGMVDFSRNSVEQNKYGWWLVENGRVNFNYTGVANYANDYGWWYIRNGKVDFTKTGIEQNKNGWWRVVKGKVDFSCNSVEENQYGWWYLVGGKVQFGYTGVANYANAYGWWYIRDGRVDFTKTGVEQNNYGWWRVKDGRVDFGYTGYASNQYGNWYIRDGKVDFSHACSHSWEPVYKTVHHDETGHYETVITSYIGYFVCSACGAWIRSIDGSDNTDPIRHHIHDEHNGGASWSCKDVPVTETVWVVDQAAYDETVIDYYRCTMCGATK